MIELHTHSKVVSVRLDSCRWQICVNRLASFSMEDALPRITVGALELSASQQIKSFTESIQ